MEGAAAVVVVVMVGAERGVVGCWWFGRRDESAGPTFFTTIKIDERTARTILTAK